MCAVHFSMRRVAAALLCCCSLITPSMLLLLRYWEDRDDQGLVQSPGHPVRGVQLLRWPGLPCHGEKWLLPSSALWYLQADCTCCMHHLTLGDVQTEYWTQLWTARPCSVPYHSHTMSKPETRVTHDSFGFLRFTGQVLQGSGMQWRLGML